MSLVAANSGLVHKSGRGIFHPRRFLGLRPVGQWPDDHITSETAIVISCIAQGGEKFDVDATVQLSVRTENLYKVCMQAVPHCYYMQSFKISPVRADGRLLHTSFATLRDE